MLVIIFEVRLKKVIAYWDDKVYTFLSSAQGLYGVLLVVVGGIFLMQSGRKPNIIPSPHDLWGDFSWGHLRRGWSGHALLYCIN